MRSVIDCEFNGFGGDLISLALVCEDGDYWYGVLPSPRQLNHWVAVNVIPVLGQHPVSHEAFRAGMLDFMAEKKIDVVIADWPSDLVHLFQVMMGPNHEETVPVNITTILDCKLAYKTDVPHNALEDAKALARVVFPA